MKRDIIDTPFTFKHWMSKLKSIWAFDTETTSLNWLDLKMIGFSICDGNQSCYVICNTKYKKDLLLILEYYLNEAKMVIMHNSSFDIMVLRKEGIVI